MFRKAEVEVLSVMFLAAAVISLAAIGIISSSILPFFGESTQKAADQQFFEQKVIRSAEQICATQGVNALPGEGGYRKSFYTLEEGYLCGEGKAICLDYGSDSTSYHFEGKCSSYSLNVEGSKDYFSSGTYNFTLEKEGQKLVVNVLEAGN